MDISDNPYAKICGYFETVLPNTGGQFAKFMALQPVSLITPKFVYRDREERSTINLLLITPSGGGKSSLVRLYEKIAYFPYAPLKVSTARLEKDLAESRFGTLICNDLSRVLNNLDTVKVLESVLEEGIIDKRTMTSESYEDNLTICFFGAGVLSDITSYVSSGLLFRVVPVVIKHEVEKQFQVGKDIVDNINMPVGGDTGIDDIRFYYRRLFDIQNDKDPENKKVVKIEISREHRIGIFQEWQYCLDKLGVNENTLWYRELYDGFRFLCSSAMLNYFNRKKTECPGGVCLHPNEEDLTIAKWLIRQNIGRKFEFTNLYDIKKKIDKAKSMKIDVKV